MTAVNPHELGTLRLVVELGTRKDRIGQPESLALLCTPKEIPSSSSKYEERSGGPGGRLVRAEMVGENEHDCDFCFGDGSKFSKEQTVQALIPWVLLFL